MTKNGRRKTCRLAKLETSHNRGNPALVAAPLFAQSALVEKSLRRLQATADRLKALPHLSASDRLAYAIGLLASPDERWAMNVAYQRKPISLSYRDFILASHGLLR